MMIQKPTLGRIVIFTAFRGHTEAEKDEYAAIIVGISDVPGIVHLVTFGQHSLYHNNGVAYHPDGAATTWRYPEIERKEIDVDLSVIAR